MDIVIPTYGRQRQTTYDALMSAQLSPILVVQAREAHLFAQRPHVYTLPPDITTIAPTRQHILENVGHDDALIMMDDDLVFYKRRKDDKTKFVDATIYDIKAMVEEIADMLESYAHVGIASREGANRNTESLMRNTRIMRVLGYDRSVLKRHDIRFDEMQVMEDFHVALQLLELGYENLVLNNWCQNQAGSGALGGCSHFRTPQLQENNARLLARMHPGLVQVVEKSTKTAWGGGTRIDVRISWKKAFQWKSQQNSSSFGLTNGSL